MLMVRWKWKRREWGRGSELLEEWETDVELCERGREGTRRDVGRGSGKGWSIGCLRTENPLRDDARTLSRGVGVEEEPKGCRETKDERSELIQNSLLL